LKRKFKTSKKISQQKSSRWKPEMQFSIDYSLLTQAREKLAEHKKIYWLLGGSGSGKSTISQALSAEYDIPIYDMDAHIYGTYHERFTDEKHPVNKAWANAENGMAWLLDMLWDAFNNFHQAALPEYLGLFMEDLEAINPNDSLLIDGGVWHPHLVAQVISPARIVCLVNEQSSREVWEQNPERYAMREMFDYFPEPDTSWQKFLEFDEKIIKTIIQEAQENNIPLYARGRLESVELSTLHVAQLLGLVKEE